MQPSDLRSSTAHSRGAFASYLSTELCENREISFSNGSEPRIRSSGFPQHLHSIRVTRRGPSPRHRRFSRRSSASLMLRQKHSAPATTCLPEEATAAATPLIAVPRLENEMEDIGISASRPLPSLSARWLTCIREKCKSTGARDVLHRISYSALLEFARSRGLCDKARSSEIRANNREGNKSKNLDG